MMFFLEFFEWMIFDVGEWKVKEEAPQHIKDQFSALKKAYENGLKNGIIIE